MFAGINVKSEFNFAKKSKTISGYVHSYFASGDGFVAGDDGQNYRFVQGAAGSFHPIKTGTRVTAVVGDDGIITTLSLSITD